MSMTLTGLIPTLYTAYDVVQRERAGLIEAVTLDASAAEAAVNQPVRSPIAPQNALEDITPGATPADSGDQTIAYTDVTITKSKAYPVRWAGEEQLSVSKYGTYNTILADQFAQGFRTITNAVEADLAALYINASRYAGDASTPFGTADDHMDFANANRILDENGAPDGDRAMILGHAAFANLEGKQSGLFHVNEAGDNGEMLRRRVMAPLHGFMVGKSGQISSHTKGTATGLDAAGGEPVGETSIALDGGDGGTLLSGDVVTFAGDTNKYVVNTGFTAASGTAVIGDPGLMATLGDTVEMTIGSSYVPNMFFHKSALVLAARQPAMPEGGDAAEDVFTMTDPQSGLTFQIAVYPEYRRTKIEIGLAWGVAAPNKKYLGLV